MTVPPSRVQLPPGPWRTVLEALSARFPRIPESQWRERFLRGRVLDEAGAPLPLDAPYRPGAQVRYFREVAALPLAPTDGSDPVDALVNSGMAVIGTPEDAVKQIERLREQSANVE